MKRRLLVVLLLCAASVVTAACQAGPAAAPTTAPTGAPAEATEPSPETAAPVATPVPARPQVVRINVANGTWPDQVDPQKSSFLGEIAVLQMMYESLLRLDNKGNVIPGAAEKWEAAPDGMSMTFHLREGLKRVDGTPITAEDFVYAYRRTVDPRVAGEYNTLIDDVVGAIEARSFDANASAEQIQQVLDKLGVVAQDERTVVVSFRQPVGYWAMIAYTWVGFPSDRKIVEADPEAWWTRPEGHNGNGPWKVDKWEESRMISFVPNPNYWGPKPKLSRVEFYFVTDSAVAFEAYRKGELDMFILAPEDLAAVEADPQLKSELFRAPAAWVAYMGMHQKKPPFDKREVRIAFAQAFDRETYCRDIWKGQTIPYLSWIPKGVPGYDETAVQKGYDPKAAVQTLIDAGYGAADSTAENPKVDCKKLGEIRLTYASSPRNHARFQFLAGNFARVFGCPVTLDPVDPTVFTSLVKKQETAPQLFLLGWVQDYPHPQNWLFVNACGGMQADRIAYCNPEFDKALAVANAEADQAKALELYKKAQKIYLDDYAGATLYYFENWFMVKPYLKGFTEYYSPGDAWAGQYGPAAALSVDTSKVGPGYPAE